MKISKRIIYQIEKEAKKYFKKAESSHDWTHVERVKKLALLIGKKEKADLLILTAAVLLHDIGRKKETASNGLICHAASGGEEAKKILKSYKIDEEIIVRIVHAISTHRYRKNNRPETLEAKILYDADKLDAIGAIGVARTFLFAGSAGSGTMYTGNERRLAKTGKDYSYTEEDSGYLEYEIKLKHIKNKMLTKTGERIAFNRDKYMRQYFKRFWEEINASK